MHTVVGIDFSNTSPLVLRRAYRLAAHGGNRVTIVNVIDADTLERFFLNQPEKEKSDIVAIAEQHLHDLLNAIPAPSGCAVETRVLTGRPSEVLAETADDIGASLIILSAHDAKRNGRLGPTASHCVRHSSVDLLLTRDWHDREFTRVVACTDFSETSRRAFERAIAVAVADGAALELVHVAFPPASDYFGAAFLATHDVETVDSVRSRAQKEVDAFVEPFADALDGVSFSTTILESVSPSRAITNHLHDTDADLAVVGTTGRNHLFGLHLGSNAERLIHDVHCSVLAVKSGRDGS